MREIFFKKWKPLTSTKVKSITCPLATISSSASKGSLTPYRWDYPPAQLVTDARNHGMQAREIDVNISRWDLFPKVNLRRYKYILKIKTMYYPDVENSRITSQKAVGILKSHGKKMTKEETEIALEFIKKFLEMPIKQQVLLAEKYMKEAQKKL